MKDNKRTNPRKTKEPSTVLGKRMRELRFDKGLTQAQLAQELGKHQADYQAWEIGSVTPQLNILIKLAQFHNVILDYLAGLIDERLPLKREVL